MTQKDFQAFKNLKEQLDKEIEELFDYIKEHYYEVLEYEEDSFYNRFSIEDDEICIEYNGFWRDDDLTTTLCIPVNEFIANPTGCADNWAKNERAKRKQEEERKQQMNEERERKELKRLKEKYEK